MSEDMCRRAMDKIRDEMARTKDDEVLEIGEAMTMLLMIAPEMSEKILAKGKTCAGAYKALESYARTNGKKCVPPRKAAELVAGYWELPPEEMRRTVLSCIIEKLGGGAEPQAHAGGYNPSAPSGQLPLHRGAFDGSIRGSSPYTGEPWTGAYGQAPLAQGSLGGQAAGSLMDDFDMLLGGL